MNKRCGSVVPLLLISLAILSTPGCSIFRGSAVRVNIRVIAKSMPAGSRIFLAGEGNVFGNWKADGLPLVRQPDGTWAGTVMLPAGKTFEFKITRGHWWTEAIDERGPQGGAYQTIRATTDTTLKLEISKWMDIDGGVTTLTASDIPTEDVRGIQYGWRYHAGDDARWSVPDFDDSSWEIVNSRLDADNLPVRGWNGKGWFRLNLDVDSSLWNVPVALSFRQAGSSEVYVDGRLRYIVGQAFRASDSSRVPVLTRNPGILVFGSGRRHVIAVRYTTTVEQILPYSKIPAFFEGIQPWLENVASSVAGARTASVREWVFVTILVALSLLHLILFGFYPRLRENLYYALSTIGVAGVWYANNESVYPVEESRAFLMNAASQVFESVALIFGVILVYSFTRTKLPRHVLFYIFAAALLAMWGSVSPGPLYKNFNDALVVIVFAEMVWRVFRANGMDRKGGLILMAGFLVFAATVIWGVLSGYGITPQITPRNDEFIYGAVVLGIAMSAFLSRRFALTSRELEVQLGQVRTLSEKSLAHERESLKAEMDRRLLTADNERKTKELDDARVLQLSMLPGNVPSIPNLDIAVRMETATEVGGDYYDFFVSDDGRLTAAIGDATGHGLKAGNMVIATKGLFNVLSADGSLDEILKTSNRAIKKMNLRMLTMCLALVRIEGDKLQYASAGMPPLLLYRKETGQVEEIVMKAMPLGAFLDFPYNKIETGVSTGDVILLVSDGLIELFNNDQESFGAERVSDSLKESAVKTADEIIGHILGKVGKWRGDRVLEDDLTILVIKVRE